MNHSGDIITAQDQFSRILMVCHTHNPLEQLDIIISIILQKKEANERFNIYNTYWAYLGQKWNVILAELIAFNLQPIELICIDINEYMSGSERAIQKWRT